MQPLSLFDHEINVAIWCSPNAVQLSCSGFASFSLRTIYSFRGNFLSWLALFLSQNFLHYLLSKSLCLIPVMTLHFLHGVLASFQCLGVLLFRCKTSREHLLDSFN